MLFDSESDEDEAASEEYNKMFALKPQFEGEKGVKVRHAFDSVSFNPSAC